MNSQLHAMEILNKLSKEDVFKLEYFLFREHEWTVEELDGLTKAFNHPQICRAILPSSAGSITSRIIHQLRKDEKVKQLRESLQIFLEKEDEDS